MSSVGSETSSPAGTYQVVAVGEVNPFGSDPYFALYHLPRTSSGNRLRIIMGLSDADYLKRVQRINLCSGTWDRVQALVAADDLIMRNPGTCVLLGARVRRVFEIALNKKWTSSSSLAEWGWRSFSLYNLPLRIVCLPHPSGRCRSWNDSGTYERARRVLSEAAPQVPWGSACPSSVP